MKSPPTITVQIVHIQGPLKGEIQEFTAESISIGRHPSCDLRFPKDLTVVSRRHAEILREGNRFKIIDKNSTNGTYVNGKKVSEAYLRDGDVVAFSETGPKFSFLAQLQDAVSEPSKSVFAVPSEQPVIGTRQQVAAEEPQAKTEEVPVGNVRVPLIVQYGPTLRSFKELPIVIGRSPKSDLAIPHPALLDRHVQIFFWQERYWVKDLTGQKLIRINQSPIGLQAPLKTDDDLSLSPQGPTFRFLGEGRLAEVEQPESESAAPLSEKEHQTSDSGAPEHEERDSKKAGSFLRKLFRG